MVREHQVIHNQVIPKAHQHGVSSCALHQYDLNGSVTNKLHYHYKLCIFWLQYYEYVYNYDQESTNYFHWVYDHRRFYSCKQNNNYSQTYMNNRIAINMIKSYSCSTQTPNNTYLGSTLIPKV